MRATFLQTNLLTLRNHDAYLKNVLTQLPSMTNRQLVLILPES
jgi:hypothetical protein